MEKFEITNEKSHATTLLRNLTNFRSTLCDVNLKVGNATIAAHKIILGAACPFFGNMFSSIFDKPEIVLTEIKAENLENIIDYIYSGRFSYESSDDLLELYRDVDYLQMHSAKDFLYATIVKNLCVNNCLATFERFGEIKTNCKDVINFISTNLLELVTETNFLELPIEKLEQLLAELTTSFELNDCERFSDKFYIAFKAWALHDIDGRKAKLCELLKFLNFKHFSPRVINEIKQDKIIRGNLQCLNWLFDAFFVHTTSPVKISGQNPVVGQQIFSIMSNGITLIFDLRRNEFIENTSLVKDVDHFYPVSSDGIIYIIGGLKCSNFSSTCYTYCPKNDIWDSFEFPYNVHNHASCALNGDIYIFGGITEQNASSNSEYSDKLVKYNVEKGLLENCATMPCNPTYFSICKNDESIFFSYLNQCQELCISRYEPETDTWENIIKSCALLTDCYFSTSYFKEKIYLQQKFDGLMLCFSLETKSWEDILPQEKIFAKFPTLVSTDRDLYAMAEDGAYILNECQEFDLVCAFNLDMFAQSVEVFVK